MSADRDSCRKPGCGAINKVGNPCTDWDCPQQFVSADEYRNALAAKDTALSEMRAELERKTRRIAELMARNVSEIGAAEDRLERMKAERNGWQRIVGQIVGEVPLPDIVRVSGTAGDLIKFFKDQREELERLKAARALASQDGGEER